MPASAATASIDSSWIGVVVSSRSPMPTSCRRRPSAVRRREADGWAPRAAWSGRPAAQSPIPSGWPTSPPAACVEHCSTRRVVDRAMLGPPSARRAGREAGDVDFAPTPRAQRYAEQVAAFIRDEVAPREREYFETLRAPGQDPWVVLPVVRELTAKARDAGLWNLFLPV